MVEVGIGDVRRLRFRTVALRGQDDLVRPGAYFVSESVAGLAVLRLRRRGWVMFLVGLLAFSGFVVGANLLANRADELLAGGEATPGVVVGVSPGFRGTGDSVDVRFSVAGVERVRSLNLDDTSPELLVGDSITVFYDRLDPERIAAPGVSNDPFWAGMLTVVAFVVGVALLPPGAVGVVRWGRRARAVRRHGWRRGRVVAEGRRLHRIRFPVDSPGTGPASLTAVTTYPVNYGIPREFRIGEVLVGGRGRHLTLVFTSGPVPAAGRVV